MSTSNTLDKDKFITGDPAIAFTEDDQTWTVATGVLASSSDEDGVYSERVRVSLFNLGSILSGSPDGAGVAMAGDNSLVSNGVGARIIGANAGVAVGGDGAIINNDGSIVGLAATGVEFGAASRHVTLTNNGLIFGRSEGVKAFSDFDGGTIHNTGVIASNDVGIEVFTSTGLVTSIDNRAGGMISGPSDAIMVIAGSIALTNRGTLSGDIECDLDPANDVVVNHGKIRGDVFLEAGNDIFNGTGGGSAAVFGGEGNDRLAGGEARDQLFGGDGQDRLLGAGGNDGLDGGFGNDTLIGGDGSDQFFFRSKLDPSRNVDRIADFHVGVDEIVLDQNVFAGIGVPGPLAAARFHVGTSAHDADDRIIYNPDTGFLIYDGNGIKPGGAIHFATLAPHLALTHASISIELLLE